MTSGVPRGPKPAQLRERARGPAFGELDAEIPEVVRRSYEPDWTKLEELLTCKYTANLVDRHVATVEKLCRQYLLHYKGFPWPDLVRLTTLVRHLVAKFHAGRAEYGVALEMLCEVASNPFVCLRASEPLVYAEAAVEFVVALTAAATCGSGKPSTEDVPLVTSQYGPTATGDDDAEDLTKQPRGKPAYASLPLDDGRVRPSCTVSSRLLRSQNAVEVPRSSLPTCPSQSSVVVPDPCPFGGSGVPEYETGKSGSVPSHNADRQHATVADTGSQRNLHHHSPLASKRDASPTDSAAKSQTPEHSPRSHSTPEEVSHRLEDRLIPEIDTKQSAGEEDSSGSHREVSLPSSSATEDAWRERIISVSSAVFNFLTLFAGQWQRPPEAVFHRKRHNTGSAQASPQAAFSPLALPAFLRVVDSMKSAFLDPSSTTGVRNSILRGMARMSAWPLIADRLCDCRVLTALLVQLRLAPPVLSQICVAAAAQERTREDATELLINLTESAASDTTKVFRDATPEHAAALVSSAAALGRQLLVPGYCRHVSHIRNDFLSVTALLSAYKHLLPLFASSGLLGQILQICCTLEGRPRHALVDCAAEDQSLGERRSPTAIGKSERGAAPNPDKGSLFDSGTSPPRKATGGPPGWSTWSRQSASPATCRGLDAQQPEAQHVKLGSLGVSRKDPQKRLHREEKEFRGRPSSHCRTELNSCEHGTRSSSVQCSWVAPEIATRPHPGRLDSSDSRLEESPILTAGGGQTSPKCGDEADATINERSCDCRDRTNSSDYLDCCFPDRRGKTKSPTGLVAKGYEDVETLQLGWLVIVNCLHDGDCRDLIRTSSFLQTLLDFLKAEIASGGVEQRPLNTWKLDATHHRVLLLHAVACLRPTLQHLADQFLVLGGQSLLLHVIATRRFPDLITDFLNLTLYLCVGSSASQRACASLTLSESGGNTEHEAIRVLVDCVQDVSQKGATWPLMEVSPTGGAWSLNRQHCALLLIAALCTDCPPARERVREVDGLRLLADELKSSLAMLACVQCPTVLAYMLCIFECIWAAIIGDARSESIFLEHGGLHAMLEALEVAPRTLQRHLLGCFTELLRNGEALVLCREWRSRSTGKTAMQVLLHLWMQEELRLSNKGKQGKIRQSSGLATQAGWRRTCLHPGVKSGQCRRSVPDAGAPGLWTGESELAAGSVIFSKRSSLSPSQLRTDFSWTGLLEEARQQYLGESLELLQNKITQEEPQDLRLDLYSAAATLSGNSSAVERGLTGSEQQQLEVLKLHPERCLLEAWEGVRSRLDGEPSL
ncbi:flagellar associated protein [Cystoisospora suis]|uniref:Flagellar associated protein n=1 Tax=Cystoisospora suis TaxID=483139 RepID=A0A2C6KM78_9APIC|nr:flagellar associated protein [Cystoisospora suis]